MPSVKDTWPELSYMITTEILMFYSIQARRWSD